MKKIALLLLGLLLCGTATSQVDPEAFRKQQQQVREQFERERDGMRKQYDDERKKAEAEFAAFRQKANEEYAAAVREAWRQMGVQPAEEKPEEPKPPQPPKPRNADLDRMPAAKHLPQSEVVPVPAKPTPIPVPAIPEAAPEAPTMQFAMYGAPCDVHTDLDGLRFRLAGVDEKSVAMAWKQLSQKKYDGLLHDCLKQRETLGLGDWGHMQMLGRMSEQLLGKGSNEAVLLQMYLLAQSGYRVRMARANGRLVILMPFNHRIYGYRYLELNGMKHYVLTREKFSSVEICAVSFPREQVANILMSRLPELGGGAKRSRTVKADQFGTMKATVAVDERLMDFLNDYPLSDAWNYYALVGLSDGVKATLYPALRSQIEGKSKKKAALMLLDFVQTGFDYATDQEQFGYERPLFGDESFYYPYNDCEDRSILFSILVRDLTGLDVVLLHYPGHLATAVHFTNDIDGDYLTVNNKRYVVCDPTYIGATIGESMPDFADSKITVLTL